MGPAGEACRQVPGEDIGACARDSVDVRARGGAAGEACAGRRDAVVVERRLTFLMVPSERATPGCPATLRRVCDQQAGIAGRRGGAGMRHATRDAACSHATRRAIRCTGNADRPAVDRAPAGGRMARPSGGICLQDRGCQAVRWRLKAPQVGHDDGASGGYSEGGRCGAARGAIVAMPGAMALGLERATTRATPRASLGAT